MGINRSKLSCVSAQNSGSDDVSFDDFHILRAIGKGSFGKVCIVQKKNTQKMYAMKYMNKIECFERDAFRNVLREIELLARLDHPFIVNLWFTFQDEEDMFMVVDLLLGGDLRYHLQQKLFFSEQRVMLYICEIALALDYLQSKKILHRDIKPDNLLLDDMGHVHITDFNIAIQLGPEPNHLATSMSGTKPYMAPEVFECALDYLPGYTYSADWWSLGCCAYEMMCGQRPFNIHSTTPLEEVLTMQRSQSLTFPDHISQLFINLMQKLLNPNPNNRIHCVNELKQCEALNGIDFSAIIDRQIKPIFIPPEDQLNFDPTFELEEMIIEANPLHKKKKRLQKQIIKLAPHDQQKTSYSDKRCDDPLSSKDNNQEIVNKQFIVYNREKELCRKEMEDKERKWDEEMQRIIIN